MAPKVTYFPARGRAEIIRLALTYAGVEYEEVSINPESFAALKETGKLLYGQVPFYEDDDIALVQSVAIARYIANKHNFVGDARQAAYSDVLIDSWNDLVNKLIPLLYPAPQPEKIKEFIAGPEIQRYAAGFEKNAALANGKFFGGDNIVLGDLAAYLIVEFFVDDNAVISKEQLPQLYALKERVAAHPAIAAYLSSEKRFPAWKIPVE